MRHYQIHNVLPEDVIRLESFLRQLAVTWQAVDTEKAEPATDDEASVRAALESALRQADQGHTVSWEDLRSELIQKRLWREHD
jgi:hypothetical protein